MDELYLDYEGLKRYDSHIRQSINEKLPTGPTVTSVNGKTGTVTLSASDVSAVPTSRTVNGKALTSDISISASDISAVPTSRKVNGKELIGDITLSASDVSAVPTSRTVNGKALSSNISLTAADVGATGRTMTKGSTVKIDSSGTTGTVGEGAEIFNSYGSQVFTEDGFPSGGNIAVGNNSHAEGYGTIAIGLYSHAEGFGTIASGDKSHSEGYHTTASGESSHAEGYNTTASGSYSHASGVRAVAKGSRTFAHGLDVEARMNQTVFGTWNVTSSSASDVLIIGCGTNASNRSNCLRVTGSMGVYASGTYKSSGADYAELFEWEDGNPLNEDRIGRFVTLRGKKIRIANQEDDFILGITSGNPSVTGDVYDDQWQGMYLHDIYGRPLFEDVEIPDETISKPDPNNPELEITEVIIPAHTEHRQKINPDYDGSQIYIPRSERPEWGCVGMLGKLVAVDDGSCRVDEYVSVGANGMATSSITRTKYRVLERLDENHIRVLIL